MDKPTEKRLKESEIFLAVIGPDYFDDPLCKAQLKYAARIKKPMFALVQTGIDPGPFPWKGIIYFDKKLGKEHIEQKTKEMADLVTAWVPKGHSLKVLDSHQAKPWV